MYEVTNAKSRVPTKGAKEKVAFYLFYQKTVKNFFSFGRHEYVNSY
ncbi:hypothetical protein MNB_SV-13-112 [hydrothermal vent metagenome]|uniref:Uncharacterized protein n=1 Tax=hydrothermal vent metagenome TaxID=652676 RepID=A0A1W1CXR3_9ZZZZ